MERQYEGTYGSISLSEVKDNATAQLHASSTDHRQWNTWWWEKGEGSAHEIRERDKGAEVAGRGGELACLAGYMAGYLKAAGATCAPTASPQYHPHGHPAMGVGTHPHPHSHPHPGAPHPGLASPFSLTAHGHPHPHPLDHGLAAFPQGECIHDLVE